MIGQRRLGLVAASATLLAAAPLDAIFDRWTWLVQCTVAVAVIAGAAALARTVRAPLWAQALGMVTALLLALTWLFPSGEELAAIVPTPDTIAWFGKLMADAAVDTRSYGVPVPDRPGLLFLAVLGIGCVAILVDLLTAGLRRPALAGLPMLAIYSVPVAIYVDTVPVLPFIIGASGFIWLLIADNVDRVRRFGRRFTGDGRDVDAREPSPLAAAGRRLAVVGVAAAVLLPLAVPGVTGGLLTDLTQADVAVGADVNGRRGGRVSLAANLTGQLTQGETVEMIRVTTTEPDPFYLRFAVADVVSAQGFTDRPPRGSRLSRSLPEAPTATGPGVTYVTAHATVQVTDAFNELMAPTYGQPTAVQGLDRNWFYDADQQVVFSPRPRTRRLRYEFDYVRAQFTPGALRDAPAARRDDPPAERLTSVPQNEYVTQLVRGLTTGKRSDYDKVLAIYRHFAKENNFRYSLQTTPAGGSAGIEAFLRNKVGFCQQYSAAMTWLVRAAGIPARVAFGFTRGSQQGGTSVLTNRNLHAWTEVYFTGFGWVPFDPTPAADVRGSSRTLWAPDNDTVQPSASASASAAVLAADPPASAPAAVRPDRQSTGSDATVAGAPTASGASSGSLLTAGLVGLLVALLAVPALRRLLVRRRRHAATIATAPPVTAPGDVPADAGAMVVTGVEVTRAREDAHAAWDELLDTMIDFRVPVDQAESPRHTAARLIREVDLQGAAVDAATLLGRAEERARYARAPLQGIELTDALRYVRRALATTVSLRTRMLAVLLPPSVLQRWRLGIGDAVARLAGRAGRGREAALRWSPRRLLAGRAPK